MLAQSPHDGASATPGATKPRQLTINNKAWTGDFDKMLERRMIRVYAPFSRSLYFNDNGRERGLAVELVRDWERYLNIKYAKQLGNRPLTIYIGQLMTKYFGDAQFSEGNRPLFAFAAYNCGAGNLAKERTEAEKKDLDPNKRFNNIEVVIAKQIGTQTTTYVRNIYKYYVAYKLTLEAQVGSRQGAFAGRARPPLSRRNEGVVVSSPHRGGAPRQAGGRNSGASA